MQSGHAQSGHNPFGLCVLGLTAALLPYPFFAGASWPMLVLVLGSATLALTAFFGPEKVGSGFLILAFATVPWNAVDYLGFLQASDVLFLIGSVLLLSRFLISRVELPKPFIIGALGFLLSGLASAAVQRSDSHAWQYTFDAFLGVVFVPIVVAAWRPGTRATAAAAVAYVVGNMVSIGYGLLDDQGTSRLYGLTPHPNALGTCSALALALTPFLWRASGRPHHRAFLGAAAAVNFLGVSLSGSRAALVAVVILTVMFPLVARSSLALIGVVAISGPAMMAAAHEAADPNSTTALGRLLGGGGSSGATDARVTGIREAFSMISDHPFIGNGWLETWNIHNVYLEVFAAIGIFGFVAFLTLLSAFLVPLFRANGHYRWLSYPAVAAAFIGLVDPAVGARYIWEPMALALCAHRLSLEAARREAAGPDGAMVQELDAGMPTRALS